IYFCTENNWQFCYASISSSLNCVPTDRMNDIYSIAIDLNLCCRFYADNSCRIGLSGWGGDGVWYPGSHQLEDQFKADVGSYQCLISNTTCPQPAASTFTPTLMLNLSLTSSLTSASTSFT
ncbi:hypothetical protein K432DRAFT_312393, partial [Lepidopterella palustris CBS 459.81]